MREISIGLLVSHSAATVASDSLPNALTKPHATLDPDPVPLPEFEPLAEPHAIPEPDPVSELNALPKLYPLPELDSNRSHPSTICLDSSFVSFTLMMGVMVPSGRYRVVYVGSLEYGLSTYLMPSNSYSNWYSNGRSGSAKLEAEKSTTSLIDTIVPVLGDALNVPAYGAVLHSTVADATPSSALAPEVECACRVNVYVVPAVNALGNKYKSEVLLAVPTVLNCMLTAGDADHENPTALLDAFPFKANTL
jgi:hypothetical protein